LQKTVVSPHFPHIKTCFSLHKIALHLMVQSLVNVTFKTTEISVFSGGLTVVITWLVFGASLFLCGC